MPELPEVQTIINGLKKQLIGAKFESFKIIQKKMRYPVEARQLEPILNQSIVSFRRKEKYLILYFANGYSLLFHLGMSGKLILSNHIKHSYVIALFQTKGDSYLIFSDVRRFGVLLGLPDKEVSFHPLIKKLGADALSKEFSPTYLWKKLQRSKRAIKDMLMDQQVVAGLGNIYVCELLFRVSLHPQTSAKTISFDKSKQMVTETKKLLRFAIQKQGSSVSDYVNSAGKKGGFQFFFSVYKKEKEPCVRCQTLIVRIKQNNRSTFFCPQCQKR